MPFDVDIKRGSRIDRVSVYSKNEIDSLIFSSTRLTSRASPIKAGGGSSGTTGEGDLVYLRKDGNLEGVASAFASVANLGLSTVLRTLTDDEVIQLANIDDTTISSTQWGYLGSLNQSLRTDDDVEFDSIGIDFSPFVTVDRDIFVNDAEFTGIIKTDHYSSFFSEDPTGWAIEYGGLGDFRQLYIDELIAKAFTVDIAQALAGSDFLTKSVALLADDVILPATGTPTVDLVVEDLEGFSGFAVFEDTDWIRLRVVDRTDGLVIADVWGTVANYTDNEDGTQTWDYTVDYTLTNTSLVGQVVYKGALALDYGQSGDSYIERTVLDRTGSFSEERAPYDRIVRWTGDDPVSGTKDVLTQRGNLKNITDTVEFGAFFKDVIYIELSGGDLKFGKNADGSGNDGLFFDVDNFWLLGEGFKVQVDEDNYIDLSGTNLDIKSEQFLLRASAANKGILIDSSQPIISMSSEFDSTEKDVLNIGPTVSPPVLHVYEENTPSNITFNNALGQFFQVEIFNDETPTNYVNWTLQYDIDVTNVEWDQIVQITVGLYDTSGSIDNLLVVKTYTPDTHDEETTISDELLFTNTRNYSSVKAELRVVKNTISSTPSWSLSVEDIKLQYTNTPIAVNEDGLFARVTDTVFVSLLDNGGAVTGTTGVGGSLSNHIPGDGLTGGVYDGSAEITWDVDLFTGGNLEFSAGELKVINSPIFSGGLELGDDLDMGGNDILNLGALSSGTITSGFGDIDIGGSSFTGNGANITSLNASNISSGVLSAQRHKSSFSGETVEEAFVQYNRYDGDEDLDLFTNASIYGLSGSAHPNYPDSSRITTFSPMAVFRSPSDVGAQVVFSRGTSATNTIAFRGWQSSGITPSDWSPWKYLWHDGNLKVGLPFTTNGILYANSSGEIVNSGNATVDGSGNISAISGNFANTIIRGDVVGSNYNIIHTDYASIKLRSNHRDGQIRIMSNGYPTSSGFEDYTTNGIASNTNRHNLFAIDSNQGVEGFEFYSLAPQTSDFSLGDMSLVAKINTDGSLDINKSTVIDSSRNLFANDAEFEGDIEADNFTTGSTGWQITYEGVGEFETLNIRGGLFASEFVVEQTRVMTDFRMSVGGGRVESVSGSAGSETITLSDDFSNANPFADGDIVLIQQRTGANSGTIVKKIYRRVASISALTVTFSTTGITWTAGTANDDTGSISAGDDMSIVGHVSNAARDHFIHFDIAGVDIPAIRFFDGVTDVDPGITGEIMRVGGLDPGGTNEFSSSLTGDIGIAGKVGGNLAFAVTDAEGLIGGFAFDNVQIESDNRSGGSDGAFTTTGIVLHKDGWISAPDFYLASTGEGALGDLNVEGDLTITDGVIQSATEGYILSDIGIDLVIGDFLDESTIRWRESLPSGTIHAKLDYTSVLAKFRLISDTKDWEIGGLTTIIRGGLSVRIDNKTGVSGTIDDLDVNEYTAIDITTRNATTIRGIAASLVEGTFGPPGRTIILKNNRNSTDDIAIFHSSASVSATQNRIFVPDGTSYTLAKGRSIMLVYGLGESQRWVIVAN